MHSLTEAGLIHNTKTLIKLYLVYPPPGHARPGLLLMLAVRQDHSCKLAMLIN